MNLRQATYADLPIMMNIVHQAQASLKLLGIDQWQNGYPTPEIISRDIESENAYVLVDNEHIIAMMTVIYNHEPTYDRIYDGKWLSEGRFVVVHRMAVDNRLKRCGVSSLLLQKAEEMALENNILSFKIDTHEGNIPMRRTLEKNGFSYCGQIILADGNPRVAYEKILSL